MQRTKDGGAEQTRLASAESTGELCVEALGCTSCCETRWRTTLRQTTEGAEQTQNEASGCTSYPAEGYRERKRVQSYLSGAGSA